MTRPGTLLIALIATVAICVQNSSFALAVGWGVLHGAGLRAFTAALPVTLGLAALWAGYVLLSRGRIRQVPVLFTLYALGILLVNELLLPTTPLKAWRAQRAVETVEVGNIRDDLALSARGNPIGIRFTFDVVFPRAGAYAVAASALQPVGDSSPYALQFAHAIRSSVEPDTAGEEFQEGIVYVFSKVFLPNFLSYDDRTGDPCFDTTTTADLSEEELRALLSKSTGTRFRNVIQVSSEHAVRTVAAAEYVTSRAYDVQAMYKTIAAEGNMRCGS
jgi:hypothetical protein